MVSYAIRVSLPFSDCSGIIQRWFDRSTTAVCYEHEADDKVSRTHIHLALTGVDCKEEALKRMWKNAPGSGNGFWSFSQIKEDKYWVYMTKGTLRPKLVKNISPAELEEHRKSWVEPSLGNDKKTDPLQYYIDLVINYYPSSKQEFIDMYTHEKFKETSTVYHGSDDYVNWLFDSVRSRTMRVFWGENRRVPHATQYKTVAGTVFLQLCENYNIFGIGIEKLKNLWY